MQIEEKVVHAQMYSNQMDRISELPDEILVNILSRLEMKEAARSRVLSPRWRNLWKLFTGSLNFDASDTMRLIYYGKKEIHIEALKYRDWVNQVLDSHEGLTLEEFGIAFDLGRSCPASIDKWVDFAIAKRVRRLELNLRTRYDCYRCHDSAYAFPSWLLDIPSDFPSFDRLTDLCLMSVSITEEDLAYFLSTCLLLEKLSVENASHIKNMSVAGQSLKLKHLNIGYCLRLKNVKVSATSLVSFKYAGPVIDISFENVPQLSLVSLGVFLGYGGYTGGYTEHFVEVSHRRLYLSQLEKLELDLKLMEFRRYEQFPKDFPEFSNLKQLELKFIAVEDQSILFLSSIIGASPFLNKLTLKYEIEWHTRKANEFLESRNVELLQKREKKWGEQARKYRHQCLNVVEFVGWVGLKNDIQFANYLLESAISLEKIIVDYRVPPFIGRSWSEKDKETALSSAVNLERKLPPTTKLIIL